MDIEGQVTIFHILSAEILWYNLKNCGTNLLLFQYNYTISNATAKQTKMTAFFFWNFNQVNLEGKRVFWIVSAAWIVRWYLSKLGENFLLIEWSYFWYCFWLIFFYESIAVAWLSLLSGKAQMIMRFLFRLIKS